MKIGIVGCGIVGAAIAYTLSHHPDWEITVWDQRSPDQWEATGAALGVLMAAIRPKLKGKHVQLCLASLQCYEQLIPALEQATGTIIPYNRQGILKLCFEPEELGYWQKTQAIRHHQGFTLEILDRHQLQQRYGEVANARLLTTHQPAIGAIYSPQDRQVDPTLCAQALIMAAQQRGVEFVWQTPVVSLAQDRHTPTRITHVCALTLETSVDAVVLASGLGTQALTTMLQQPLVLQPVLGQAIQVRRPLQFPATYPVINGGGVHLVPDDQRLGVGATVEFPGTDWTAIPMPDPGMLAQMRDQAISLYPPLAEAEVLRTWSGLRPRPHGRSAPVIERLPGYTNVVVATGHYRNGVLLAPITAERVRELLMSSEFEKRGEI